MGQAFPAPTFGHAAEAFAVAHAAPGAWSAGTAVKYRQTLAALGAQLARTAPAAARDVAVLGTPAGAAALNEAFAARVRRARPGDPRPAPGRAALRAGLVGGRVAGRRPRRRVGTVEGPGRHHQGADPRAGRRDLAARRPAARQGAVADAVRDRRRAAGDPRPGRPRPRPARQARPRHLQGRHRQLGLTGRPAPPCCCPGCWPDGARGRCS